MTTPSPLVAADSLVKEFGPSGWLSAAKSTIRAVDGVSVSIAEGDTLGLVGESGSGKTTLARLMLRLIEPTSGTVRFRDRDVSSLDSRALRALRRHMQIVFQDSTGSLNPRMRVGTAVKEPLTVHQLCKQAEVDERVAELFGEVGLDPCLVANYPHELSGGQRQRVGIARALSVEPDFLVLDEPVSALDVSVQAQVLNLLTDLKESRSLTYLLIGHDLAVVRYLADRVAVMYFGRIVETAPAASLFDTPRHPYTQVLLASVPGPHPDRRPQRIPTLGEPLGPVKSPPGCPFFSRCPHPKKHDRCGTQAPALMELEAGHQVACFHAEA